MMSWVQELRRRKNEVTVATVVREVVSFPFPFRDGLMGYLYLPTDLTASEAKRISAYVTALAREETRNV
jgi:hypothetical protein